MENLLRDKEIWIVGSVCLVASFLWRGLWNLLSSKRKNRPSRSTDTQVNVRLVNAATVTDALLHPNCHVFVSILQNAEPRACNEGNRKCVYS